MMQYVIPAASAVVVALVGTLATIDFGRRKKQAERNENRANMRMEERRLSMEMMSATIALSLATAAAVEGRKVNGETKRARAKAILAQEAYARFLEKITSRQVAK